jgi:hypothetical protein
VGRLRADFGVELSVRDLYEARTPKHLGTTLQAALLASTALHAVHTQLNDQSFEEEEI